MRSKSRIVSVALVAVVPLLLVTACGGGDGGEAAGSGSNLTPITGSSYVTIEPATTTTTTSLAPGEGAEPGSISQQEQSYTVKAGDSVSKIASLYGVASDVLANYNSWPQGIQHPIFPGDVVRIPPGSKVPDLGGATGGAATGDTTTDTPADTTGATDESDETATDGQCPTTYVIQSGDTTRIKVAEKFGITYEQMDAANTNTPGYANFVVGTPITIPCP